MNSNRSHAIPLPAALRLRELGARLLTIDDPSYPPGLRDLPDAPRFLTVLGNLPLGGVAIVGSRNPPPGAAEFTFALARKVGVPVISGLAVGIDAAAHRGALAGGHATLAYVGTGLGVVYPPANRTLAVEIVAHRGGLASERLPDERVTRWALVRRDRLQAAHARAVVLVCSEAGGGAMHTLRFAKRLLRPRFALVAQDGAAYAGNRHALTDGASPLPWNVEDVLRMLRAALSRTSDA